MQEYCAGITMATDWGEDAEEQRIDRRLVRRVLGYLLPYWRAGVLALVCIAAGALGEAHVNLIGSLALFRRIFTVLDHPCDVADHPSVRELPTAAGTLELEQVTFAYPGQARPALSDFSARIEPGQLVALVGPSGAGKTTLTTLIPRFYDPQAGCVTLDGHDVRDLTLESLRRHIGIVFQDTFPFHASIRENLLYARPDATETQMIAAARSGGGLRNSPSGPGSTPHLAIPLRRRRRASVRGHT